VVATGALAVDGVALEVVTTPGKAGLPTLVFLHEGLGCIAMWRSFPTDLASADGAATLVYSRGGYGRSDPVSLPRPVSYMHDEADRVLVHLLDEFGIDRCVLVGHSDGASIALLAAGGCVVADRIAGVIAIAPHVFVEDVSVAAIAAARDAFVDGDLRHRLARHHDDVDNAFWGWNDVWLSPAFRDWDITDRLGGVACPVAVIQGADDPYGTLAQVDTIAAGVAGPCTTTIVPGVGHSPHLEAPAATLAACVDLIAHVETGPRQR
jgi:pimeloyl-ACP methyl ester carboxylesterase